MKSIGTNDGAHAWGETRRRGLAVLATLGAGLLLGACSADGQETAGGTGAVDLHDDVIDVFPDQPPGQRPQAYTLSGRRWNRPVVLWKLDSSEERLRNAVVTGLNAYDSVTRDLDFAEAPSVAEAQIVFSRNDALGANVGGRTIREWDGNSSLIRATVEINESGLVGTHDNLLIAVTMHEVGHAIGLNHSTRDAGANMSASFGNSNGVPLFNFLIEEDIQGAQSLYNPVNTDVYRYIPYPWVVKGIGAPRDYQYNQWPFADYDINRFRTGTHRLQVTCPKGTLGCK